MMCSSLWGSRESVAVTSSELALVVQVHRKIVCTRVVLLIRLNQIQWVEEWVRICEFFQAFGLKEKSVLCRGISSPTSFERVVRVELTHGLMIYIGIGYFEEL